MADTAAEGLRQLLEAVLGSDLPRSTPLVQKALAPGAGKVSLAGKPYSIFRNAPELNQLETWDPEFVSRMLGHFADLGEQYPRALSGLENIAPTKGPTTVAHIQRATPGVNDAYTLGLQASTPYDPLLKQQLINNMVLENNVGALDVPMTTLYRGEDRPDYPTRGLEWTDRPRYAENFAGNTGKVYQVDVPTSRLQDWLAGGVENQGYTLPPEVADRAYAYGPVTTVPRAPMSVDPTETFAKHEFGHVLHGNLQQFVEDPRHAGGEIGRQYDDLMNRIISANLNPETQFSGYGQSGIAKNLQDQVMRYERSVVPEIYPEGPDLRALHMKMFSGNRAGITPGEIANLPRLNRYGLSREPLAEAFAAHATPIRSTAAGIRPTAMTQRAISAGQEFANLLEDARGVGFKGAIAPELLFKGAGGLAAGLAAPKLIDYVTPGDSFLNKALKGAASGAGYGSMFGPEGALVGAGLGALATQLNIPGVSSFLGG